MSSASDKATSRNDQEPPTSKSTRCIDRAVMQIPTTVMAAIDASIGIKTAVNFNNRKNKMGTYCSPLAVFIDRSVPFCLP